MKLLTYSSQRYLLFSALLVLLSIPVFYLVLEKLFIRAIDESLKQQATLLPQYTRYIKSENDLVLWKNLDWDVAINLAGTARVKDQPFTLVEHSKVYKENEQYRALQKEVKLLNKNYIVTFKSSLIEKDDLIQAVLTLQITLLLLLLVGLLFINNYISKKLWAPFQDILNYLKTFELDKNPASTQLNFKIDEFKELDCSVKDLIFRVNKTYLSQKEFTENASHELQTPLAIIKSKLELFLQEEQLSETQSHLIDEMNTVLTGLEQLNINLLLLAKMDNEQFQLNEEFSIAELIEKTIEELSFFTEAAQQQITFQQEADVRLSGNPQLFRQLLMNLILNAIQYSVTGSEIKIMLSSSGLEVINPGKEFTFKEDKLFKRFSKHQVNATGNGLGLAISQKIARLHKFQLNYIYQQDNHHFIINF